jgi:hypothetical protein
MRFPSILAVAIVCLLGGVSDAQVLKRLAAPVKQLAQCFGPNCQQSQTFGGFVVGQRDADGAVITSVGPVADPAPMSPAAFSNPATADDYTHMHDYMSSAAKSVGQVSALGFRSDFRQSLLKAARSERGKSLTAGEYFAIFVGSLNPAKMETARLAVIDSAIQDGVLTQADAAGAIDWEKLFELLIKYLPMILDLFTGK